MNSRRSAQDLVKPLKAEGYGSTLGSTTMSVDDLRKAISKAAKGDDDAMSVVIAKLAPYAWQSAHCLVSNYDAAEQATSQGLVTLVKQIASNRGEYDPSVEIVRTTREAISSGLVSAPAKAGFFRRFMRPRRGGAVAGAKDRRAEIAFAALPEDLRFLLWHLEVRHFTPATVARISGKATREVEDGRRHAALGFRRYYIEATSRENMSVECSAALDLVPDYASGRLDRAAVTSLEGHFDKCPDCKEVATSLRALEGRLLDAMPPVNDKCMEAAALAFITNFGEATHETGTVEPAPKHTQTMPKEPDKAKVPVASAEASEVEAGAKPKAEVKPKVKVKPPRSKETVVATATPVAASPVVLAGKDEAVTAVIDIRDHDNAGVSGFDDEALAPDVPARYPDDKTWWLRDGRKPAVIVGSAAVLLSIVSTAVYASRSTTGDETAQVTTTTSSVVATTMEPPVTASTAAPVVTTVAPVIPEVPTTTSAPSGVPTTQAQRRTTPTTARPAPTTTRAPATTAAPVTTTTRPPNFAIVDLPTPSTAPPTTPPTSQSPLVTITPPAPEQ